MGILQAPAASRFSSREINPPSGFPWPFATYPIRIFGSFGRFSTNVVPRSLVNPAIWSSSSFIHVDPINGNDASAAVVNVASNRGSVAQSISRAITLGNATGGPYRVLCRAGTYNRALSPHGNSGLIFPTQHCSLETWGGRAVVGIYDALTWAVDGTFTNCYSTTRSNVTRVFDPTVLDSSGYYTELTLVSTPTLCNTTPGSWAQSGSTLYVHRADGSAVTNANTRAFLGSNLPTLQAATANVDFYASGFDLEGGGIGAFAALNSATRNIVLEDCTMRYSGSLASPIDCAQMTNQNGLVAFFRCDASRGTKDGFNVHNIVTRTYLLTVDCTGRDNGVAPSSSTSNNGLTFHEGTYGIDVNGVYQGCGGANVHIINTTFGWMVGTLSRNALGDILNGGVVQSTGFRTNDTAQMWLDNTLAQGCIFALDAQDSSSIHTRRHGSSGGVERATLPATLTPY